jgi:hypothetical protein
VVTGYNRDAHLHWLLKKQKTAEARRFWQIPFNRSIGPHKVLRGHPFRSPEVHSKAFLKYFQDP